MNRSITTYDELLQEKERLKELLKVHKAQILTDVKELKGELKPLLNVSHMVGKFTSRENGKDAVVTAGTNLTIDLVITKLFAKSNFIVRNLLPVLLKNFTSHYLPKAMPAIKRTVNNTFNKDHVSNGVDRGERVAVIANRGNAAPGESVRITEPTRVTRPAAEADGTRVVETQRVNETHRATAPDQNEEATRIVKKERTSEELKR